MRPEHQEEEEPEPSHVPSVDGLKGFGLFEVGGGGGWYVVEWTMLGVLAVAFEDETPRWYLGWVYERCGGARCTVRRAGRVLACERGVSRLVCE